VRIFLALLVGILLGGAAVWYYSTSDGKARVNAAGDQIQTAAKSASNAVQDKLHALDLRPQDIKDELARSGQVVRRKVSEAGQSLADATADARITAAIKAKMVTHRELSALSISVNTTSGIVTLSGAVPSVDAIGKAILLAMETDGVREVISTLQVRVPATKPQAGTGTPPAKVQAP
jgi:osmotically-inducible protein OsmY